MDRIGRKPRWPIYAEVIVPWGRFKGRRIFEVAESDQGLLWLDWWYAQQPIGRLYREALRRALKRHQPRIGLAQARVALELKEL